MDEKRKSEIAWALLKRHLAETLRLGDIAGLKRNLGNTAKQTGIPMDELLGFAKLLLREAFEDQFNRFDRGGKAPDEPNDPLE